MDQGILYVCIFAAGIAAGALIATATYATELRRIVRFMQGRATRSNARLTRDAVAPGLTGLACAINTEIDRETQMHIDAVRRQQEFQRDLSALSHDIRTPLMGAKGYLQLAVDETDPVMHREHFKAAIGRIEATASLLDQLFAYTKASDPDLSLICEPLELAPLVEHVLLGYYPAFEARGWEPELAVLNRAAVLCVNREACARILDNLVSNALRHGSDAPIIEIDTECIRVINRVAHPSELDATRLFDRFYQADAARGGEGAGLGLATSLKLAQAMGLKLTASLAGDMLTITLASEMHPR